MIDEKVVPLTSFGATIKQLRIQEKITRSRFGKAIGMSVFKVDKLENGNVDVDLAVMLDIAHTLHLTASTFFELMERR